MPTICRLNGGVYGGSTDLALACDFRIGVDTAEMFMPAARLGLHYYKSGIRRYVSRLGVDNAKRLFLTAEKIGAAEMLRIGYLTAMVPPEALDEEVDRLAAVLAGNAPVAMRGMKRAINEFARGKLDEEAADRRHRDSMRGRRDQGRHQGVRREAAAEVLEMSLAQTCGDVALPASSRKLQRSDEGSIDTVLSRRGSAGFPGRRNVLTLLVDERHGVGDAGARGPVAVGLVLAVGIAERDAAHHAAVVAEPEMPAHHARNETPARPAGWWRCPSACAASMKLVT